MVALHTSKLEIEQLKAAIIKKMKHTYLNKYIDSPVIDEEKLIILSIIINHTESLSIQTKSQYIITTMLVQIALDTHELVPATNLDNESETMKTTRQLTVLAGDYFSGLYYFLLSEIEDIGMIHIVASAIKEINEYKMKIYYNEMHSFQEYISIVKKIESLLIVRVAEFVNQSNINDITENLIITSKLIREKRNLHNKDLSPILSHWTEYAVEVSSSYILNTVEAFIKENTGQLEEGLTASFQISSLKICLRSMLDEFIYNGSTVAKEG